MTLIVMRLVVIPNLPMFLKHWTRKVTMRRTLKIILKQLMKKQLVAQMMLDLKRTCLTYLQKVKVKEVELKILPMTNKDAGTKS